MVIVHGLRSAFYSLQGARSRGLAIEQYSAFCDKNKVPLRKCSFTGEVRLPWTMEVKNWVYVGFRTGSHIPYNHVNHARFAEAMEFGRWHSLGINKTLHGCRRAQMYPTVQSINVQYLTEMPMMQRIVSRVQYWGPTEDAKAINCLQQLESIDGKTIYACGNARIAWVNFPAYKLPDGTKPPRGAVAIPTVMERLGCDKDEIEALMAFKPIDGIDQPFGSLVSSYDSTEARMVMADDSTSPFLSLRRTYPNGLVADVNVADKAWRSTLGDAQRERREFFAKKKKTAN